MIFKLLWRSGNRRGFALLLVISVLALIAFYLLAAEGTIQTSMSLRPIYSRRLEQSEVNARLLAQLSHSGAPATQNLKVPAILNGEERSVTATRADATGADAFWNELPGLSAKPGDALVTMTWGDGPMPTRVQRYLINTQGQRRAPIRLPMVDAAPSTPAKAEATHSSTTATTQTAH